MDAQRVQCLVQLFKQEFKQKHLDHAALFTVIRVFLPFMRRLLVSKLLLLAAVFTMVHVFVEEVRVDVFHFEGAISIHWLHSFICNVFLDLDF